MNILVIGNGFDIAHGLPTQYGDFLNFIKKYYKYKKIESSSAPNDGCFDEIIRLKTEKIELYDEIEVLTKDNAWYLHFDSIYESRMTEGKDGWIDFEREISNIIQIIDKFRIYIINKHEQGSGKANLNDWQIEQLRVIIWGHVHFDYKTADFDIHDIQRLKDRLVRDLNKIIRCLEIYLAHCVHIEDCSVLSVVEQLDIQHVLSFNYTDTYRLLYDKGDKSINYHHIHGIAKEEDNIETCNMILGIDEYLSDSLKNIDNEFVEFKKFFQRIFKGTGNIYTEWIGTHKENLRVFKNSPNPPTMNIYIFGHSLDNTDGDVLRNLILQEHTKTTIFYHKREALGNQIANLVAVLGEDELIKRTNKGTQTIFFESTEKAI